MAERTYPYPAVTPMMMLARMFAPAMAQPSADPRAAGVYQPGYDPGLDNLGDSEPRMRRGDSPLGEVGRMAASGAESIIRGARPMLTRDDAARAAGLRKEARSFPERKIGPTPADSYADAAANGQLPQPSLVPLPIGMNPSESFGAAMEAGQINPATGMPLPMPPRARPDNLEVIGRGMARPQVNGVSVDPLPIDAAPPGAQIAQAPVPDLPTAPGAAAQPPAYNEEGIVGAQGVDAASTTPAAPMTPAERRAAALKGVPAAPEVEIDHGSPWRNLMRFGLATSAAAGRPGSSALSAVGEGGLAAMEGADRDRFRATTLRNQQFQNEMLRTKTAQDLASADVSEGQKARELDLREKAIVEQGRARGDQLQMHYAKMRQDSELAGLDRDSRQKIAEMGRDTQKTIADAASGDRRAIAELEQQSRRDQALNTSIESAINAEVRARASDPRAQPLTPHDEARIRERVIRDSPGTTMNMQLRTGEAMAKYRQNKAAIEQRFPEGEERTRALKALDGAMKTELDAIDQDRPRVRAR